MTSRAAHYGDDNTYDATPAGTEKFARMLEQSSLGSAESRSARLLGAETVAKYPAAKSFWLEQAPTCPDIADVHSQVAELFEAEQQLDVSELWLRAAVSRTEADGLIARRLGILLERRHQTEAARLWYLRATEKGDAVAAGRLASMAELMGAHDVASLIMSVGRSNLNRRDTARADELAGKLSKAGKRHSKKLVDEFSDNDLLFWAGCIALTSGTRHAASTCFTAAMGRGHRVATLLVYDLTTSSDPNDVDELADVQSITARVIKAIEAESPNEAVPLLPNRTEATPGFHVPEELLHAASTGDRAAVARVLEIIRPLVLRYCRGRLGTRDRSIASADDIAQEVCLAAIMALPAYRLQGKPFLAFVIGIAARKVIDAERAAADLTEESAGPEQRALSVKRSAELRRLLDQLPEKQREVLILRIVVGLSEEEIAKIVGSTPGAVRVAQHRALGKLRKALPEEQYLDA